MTGSPPLSPAARRFLAQCFPGDAAVTSPEETLVYGTDASRRFAPASAVVRPETLEQVRELLAFAQAERIPILPRGRATNTVGDCVPVTGGIVVSTARLNRILEIDARDFVAVVEPGVVTGDLQAALAKERLFYAPDPASVKFSTLGGNAATCAGGMRAVKYGVTRDHILGIEAVLPGGDLLVAGGRTHKNVVGLDLTRLLVGSEGTLAFFTKLTVKLLPLPVATATLAVAYPTVDAALSAADDVFRAGILPVALELLGREAMQAVAAIAAVPWPDAAGAALFIRVDGSPEAVAADLRLLTAATAPAGPVWSQAAATPEAEEPLWELRRLLNPASFKAAPDKISDDVTVPRGRLREAAAGIAAIGREQRVRILVFGHIGDGNLHVNIMHDAAVADERDRALTARERVLMLCLGLRGTLSGEHGVGLSKLPFLDRQLDATHRTILSRIKAVFDPAGIMNPEKAY
ncbi:D-lactate dehydrogenase (cytochrome) [Solidesulfovibrio carbinoliphilus subsp. oakridgensis]|uniref:D-lactate dehydrogenase (Cytochrome) n=1 Tax=Solidesulfovibrio carbinoliphilus subsp. oakridgensis TaxID=694327 RepID=G7Q926_9BACT|nr:FAD-linked oxidase C-terminal domain-containing protein [Solidesulfovibrio carbinoliphilus]EHJ47748.1 D-lactate dehydrogenase (cytochrome) [Solidesulfovibrio carbinoliphilus subsp. oakridgensis]